MRRLGFLVVLTVLASACGDGGVHHLPDAPPGQIVDAAGDAPIDSGPDLVALHVAKDGTGTGRVQSTPDGILCGTTCDGMFDRNTLVTLTAVPATDSVFTSWGGACSGTTPTCDVTLANAASVTATFTLATFTVTIAKSGAGSGTVAGGAITCGATCTATVDYGTVLVLTATPAALSTFAGWGGGCSGTTTCTLTVTADTSVTANFALNDVTLFVTPGGNGSGTVTSSDSDINCGTTCQHTYSAGDMTTLTAVPATGSTFTGWSGGGCSGTAPCTLTLTAATTVTATFALQQFMMTVARAGNGNGSVTSMPAGIACGTSCTALYNYGTSVTLTPAASVGSTFTGWSGACSGTGACVVPMTQAQTVTATFTLDQFVLSVAKTGTGAGTVTGGGIACGTTCMETANYGTMVTLTATPATGSTFTGWGGACSGTGTCMVTLNMAQAVTATFTLNMVTLSVVDAGTGTGTVTGGAIDCGTTCSETVGYGTMVTLTAAPATGSTFTGWSGACSGTGSCVTTVTMAETVTATFTLETFVVSAATAGAGTGTVAGGMINCGTACSETVSYGTMVTLTATPATGSTFTGWSGACSGTASCVVTVTMAESVTATFALQSFAFAVVKNGTGAGTVTGGGINCGTTCSEQLDYGTMITLTATPSSAVATASTFTGWSGGGCSGTGTCTVTVAAATTVTATFTLSPNIIFATSTTHNGTLGGLAGADSICMSLAGAANLPGTYVAYLSTATINAPTRVGAATGWVRVDGKPVMNAITQLAGGTMFNPPSVMDNGVAVVPSSNMVWTGTSTAGVYANTCSTVTAGPPIPWTGTFGSANFGLATSTMSDAVDSATANCAAAFHLYCLGTDRTAIAQ